MRLVAPAQIPSGPAVREYRDVSWRGLFFAGLCFALVTAYVILPKGANPAWGAAAIPAALSLLCLLLALWRRIGAGNAWLVREAPDGLYINPGYSDGYPVPGAAADAIFIPNDALVCIQVVQEVLRLPHRFGATRHHLDAVDFRLGRAMDEAVMAHIRGQQIRFRNAGKTGPYPVRIISPTRLRLAWGWVQPGAAEAAQAFSERHAAAPKQRVLYPEWDALDPAQQEVYLEELWRMGMVAESLFLGRMRYGLSKHKVRHLLEERNPTA